MVSPPKESYNQAHRITNNPTPKKLAMLYKIHADKKLLAYLVYLQCSKNDISRELTKRTEPYKLSRTILLYKMRKPDAPWLVPLLKLAKADRITSFQPSEEDAEDLQLLAIKAVIRFHRKLARTIVVKQPEWIPFPNLPSSLELPKDVPPYEDQFYARVLRKRIEISARDLIPILRGDVEKGAPEYVHQILKEHFRKMERRRTKRVWLSSEELDKAGGVAQDSFILHLDAARAYRIAEKLWGDPGKRFLDAISEGKTRAEASNEAFGMTRQSGYTRLLELRTALENPHKASKGVSRKPKRTTRKK